MFVGPSRRVLTSAAVLVAWSAGIVAFARKEMNRTVGERLTEIALRIAPGARYYAVERAGRHVGFSSTTVDTLARTLQITEYRVSDAAPGPALARATTQTVIRLSRGLALREFAAQTTDGHGTRRVRGWSVDDSTIAYVGTPAADTQQIRVEPGTVPSLLAPFVVALGYPLDVGATRDIPTIDLDRPRVGRMQLRVAAESTFVLADSAVFDAARAKWTAARVDTTRAWRIESPGAPPIWIDALGQPVQWEHEGLVMRRTAYEMAFENWRLLRPGDSPRDAARRGDVRAGSLLTRGIVPKGDRGAPLRVRLSGMPLEAFDLAGWGQTRSGDTVTVAAASHRSLLASFPLPPDASVRQRFASTLGSAPFIEADAPAIRALAGRLAHRERDPARVIRRIVDWMRDSVATDPSSGVSSALQLLRERRGEVDGRAQLFVALCRAAGIPARSVAGIVVTARGSHPHAWAEVVLQGWTPVDPTFAEFPASSNHLRLLVDGASAFDDFARAVAPLRIDVLPGTQPRDN